VYTLPLAAIGSTMMGLLLSLVAIFLILLVLVQRGRGGGLAGALGGMGGSSAFGAKAGDVFTKITVVAAAIWIFLCIAAARWGGSGESLLNITTKSSSTLTPGASEDVQPGEQPAATPPAGDDSAATPAAESTPAETAPAAESAPAETAPAAEAPANDPAEMPPADAAN
jgi:preprotein translocase subunit SecG